MLIVLLVAAVAAVALVTSAVTITHTSLTLSFDRPALNDFAHTQVSPSRGCVRMGSSG